MSPVTVSLDGAFFDDGTFVGPDTSGYFEQMQAMVAAKLDLLRDVATAKENDKEDEAFEAIAAKSLEPDSTPTSESSPEEHYKQTLFIALNTNCSYCRDSLPFYRKLALANELSEKKLRIVALLTARGVTRILVKHERFPEIGLIDMPA